MAKREAKKEEQTIAPAMDTLNEQVRSTVAKAVIILGEFNEVEQRGGGVTARLFTLAKTECGKDTVFEEVVKVAGQEWQKVNVTGEGKPMPFPQSWRNAKSIILQGFKTEREFPSGMKRAIDVADTFNALKETLKKWKDEEKANAAAKRKQEEVEDSAVQEEAATTVTVADVPPVLARFVAEVTKDRAMLAAFEEQAADILSQLHEMANAHAAAALAAEHEHAGKRVSKH